MLTGNYNRAAPSNASYMRPALYHYAANRAKALPRKRGIALAPLLAHKPPKARAAWLAANYARHLAGLPLLWPKPYA